MAVKPPDLPLDRGSDGTSLVDSPVAWMFLGTLLTFLIARQVTRYIRRKSQRADQDGRSAVIGDISLGGIHIHHQVFGIVIMLIAGLIMISTVPDDRPLIVVSVLFGIGVGLVFDEFALWLHLKDVYWADEGRQSTDAIFCVLAIAGLLMGGANLVSGKAGSGGWWLSIAGLAVILFLSIICTLKGKLVTGVVGVLLWPIALGGALRLAKPDSWWARRRYSRRPQRMARSERRFGPAYHQRWNRIRDFISGAPNALSESPDPFHQPQLPWPRESDSAPTNPSISA